MANSETGTSTSNTLGGEYQVFLSFRGPDTRRGFTSSLYHALVDAGIRVFIDDEELRPGEKISGDLLRAIDDSKLYIPIFSKNYASSHWCLRELAKMVDNTTKSKEDGKKKVILPIFYDVIPDDVKLKTALYSEAIFNLEQKMEDQKKKFSSEDVETWRQALKEVDGTKGWELEKYPGYGDLIKSVVNEVVVRLKTRQRKVTEDLVGMEDRIAAMNNLLDIDSDGVQLIGIYGMGGIGKTTLAKIIFNQLCPSFGKNCSFLDDVRETAKTTKRLVELQQKLLSDISYSRASRNIDNIDHGINVIGETICNKKMLIVLDDVDEGNQIQKLIRVNPLNPGTRILVTTRDQSVLKIRGFRYEILPYEMEGLSQKDALQLFSWHAFNDSSPPPNYYTLSKDIVSTVDGLPLALQAIGSSLFDQENKKIWKERLEKLRKTPHKDVLEKLRISYEALEPDQQQIFLDVACFFIGENKTNPMYMWEDCRFSPEDAIDVLIKRCMIKVLDDDEFGMHDQFRDLGRAIAKQEHSRLWDKDDIICELRLTKIKESVQALCFPRYWNEPIGTVTQPPITVTSEQMKRFPHLRFLSLTDVICCQGDGMGCLSELKWINLHYPSSCSTQPVVPRVRWFEAPDWLRLENVVIVNLSWLDFTEDVFDSLIKGARKLKVLSLHDNRRIHRTPTFPEDLVLEELTISNCFSLMEIDCSIGKLTRLTGLSIINSCSQLRKLPEQIGELRNLQHLSLGGCSGLSELPDSVWELVSLTTLDVSCTSITRLPNSIGRLSSLSSIDVSFTPIEELPSTMSELDHLQTLRLRGCHGIQELPKLPRSLTTLNAMSTSLLTIPNLSYLTNLVELALSDFFKIEPRSEIIQTCDLRWIGSLSKLSKLRLLFYFLNVCAPTIVLGSLSLLKKLILHGVDLPTSQHLPSNLIVLNLRGKRELKEETAIHPSSSREPRENKMLRQLQAPELIDHCRGAFILPSSLKMLQIFRLSKFPELQDIQFDYTLGSLEEFSVEACSSLKRLGGLSNLKNLKQLSIEWCESLQVVEGINELEFLHELRIKRCRSMERIFDASSSKIPNKCWIGIRRSGELLDSGCDTWDSYREKILNGTKQAPDFEIETTDSETEIGEQASDSDVETTDS